MDPAQFLTASGVIIVAGKGGVGKTTVTAALAVAASAVGLRTLIVEVEGKGGMSSMFSADGFAYDEVQLIAAAADHAGVRARTITPDDALLDYLGDRGLQRISNRLVATGLLDIVATAVPGIRDILVLGKVKQLERSRDQDLILLDAPAAGHAITFLRSASGLADAVKVGPINTQAEDVLELLGDPGRCRVVLVTIPEETPVNELVETAYSLEDTVGVALGPVVVNGVVPDLAVSTSRRSRRPPRSGRACSTAKPRCSPRRPRSAGPGDDCRTTSCAGWPTSCRCPSCTSRSCSPPTSDLPTSTPCRRAPRGHPRPSRRSGPRPRPGGGGRLAVVGDAVTARTLSEVVDRASVVVCCGSGGVGKTTTAALIAMHAAQQGRRSVVVTIDPARRLADALGLQGLTNDPSPITGPWNEPGGAGGSMSALMLDTKGTFDGLVKRYSADPDQAERILANAFYRNISGALSGTQEYMASEKLYELAVEGDFDLVVVDTPRPATPWTSSTRRNASPTSSTTGSTRCFCHRPRASGALSTSPPRR